MGDEPLGFPHQWKPKSHPCTANGPAVAAPKALEFPVNTQLLLL